MNFKHKTWIHLLFWGVMLLYLFISPLIKDELTIVNGKPVSMDGVSLVSSDLIKYDIDRVIKSTVDGQILHQVQGWSFIDDDSDQSLYDIAIVLSSDRSTYFFPTMPVSSVELMKAFPEVKVDLSNSGFVCLIAKETLKSGTYDIGILYTEKSSGKTYYRLTNSTLIKTYNQLQLQNR